MAKRDEWTMETIATNKFNFLHCSAIKKLGRESRHVIPVARRFEVFAGNEEKRRLHFLLKRSVADWTSSTPKKTKKIFPKNQKTKNQGKKELRNALSLSLSLSLSSNVKVQDVQREKSTVKCHARNGWTWIVSMRNDVQMDR